MVEQESSLVPTTVTSPQSSLESLEDSSKKLTGAEMEVKLPTSQIGSSK